MRKFSANVENVFSAMNTSYDEVKNLMFDLYKGELAEGISKRDAEEKIREISLKIFGLSKDASKRDRKRAYDAYGRQYFDVIEEVVDWTVSTGLKENEWFNILADYKNLADGDENLFYQEAGDVILSVARMGKRHHDTILQRLPEGTSYSIDTDVYGAAIGADIDRFLQGKEDWTKLIDAITKAFIDMTQNLVFEAVKEAVNKLPLATEAEKKEFVMTSVLSATTKKDFDKLLQNVSIANDNADVIVMGTMAGLQSIEDIAKVDWIADSQKEAVASNSVLGNYGRYQLVEIPQKFAKNDVTKRLYDDNVLWIFAVDTKLVEMVDVGETLIDEITERGEANGRIDDIMKYEVQRELGVGVKVNKFFGQWTNRQA